MNRHTVTNILGVLVLSGGLSIGIPQQDCEAQIAVTDALNLTQNSVTAFQQTLNTLESIFQSAQWILELTGYDDAGSSMDLTALEDLINQTQRVLWDIQGLNQTITSLFSLDSAPTSTGELQQRLWEIRRHQYEVQTAARQVQTLGSQLRQTLNDMRGLWDRILSITGNKQGQQQIQALLVEIQKTDARAELSQAAFQQAILSEAQEQVLIDEALQNINAELFATMPRRR